MIIDHLDNAKRQGFQEGYHRGIEDIIQIIYTKKTVDTGLSKGTVDILDSIVSEGRVLDLRKADEYEKRLAQ